MIKERHILLMYTQYVNTASIHWIMKVDFLHCLAVMDQTHHKLKLN